MTAACGASCGCVWGFSSPRLTAEFASTLRHTHLESSPNLPRINSGSPPCRHRRFARNGPSPHRPQIGPEPVSTRPLVDSSRPRADATSTLGRPRMSTPRRPPKRPQIHLRRALNRLRIDAGSAPDRPGIDLDPPHAVHSVGTIASSDLRCASAGLPQPMRSPQATSSQGFCALALHRLCCAMSGLLWGTHEHHGWKFACGP